MNYKAKISKINEIIKNNIEKKREIQVSIFKKIKRTYNYSNTDLAKILNMKLPNVSRYVSGKLLFRDETLLSIIDKFEL